MMIGHKVKTKKKKKSKQADNFFFTGKKKGDGR